MSISTHIREFAEIGRVFVGTSASLTARPYCWKAVTWLMKSQHKALLLGSKTKYMKINGRRDTKLTGGWRQMVLVIVSFAVVMGIGLTVFLTGYGSHNDKVLYQERLHQMKEVTSELFSGIERVINNQWYSADILCNYVEYSKPSTDDELISLMGTVEQLQKLDRLSCLSAAVCENGRYYTSDGFQGDLGEIEKKFLVSSLDQVSFVSKPENGESAEMFFLNRLDEPITIQSGEGSFEILYYGIVRDMNELDPVFECDSYGGNNSVYVLNSSGEKLFSSNNSALLEENDPYHILTNMTYLHDSSFSDVEAEFKQNGIAYSNAVLDGTEYYYSLYQMKNTGWTLLFLVPSEYVAEETVDLIDSTVRAILTFAVSMLVVCSALLFFILQRNQKQAVESERRNSEMLSKMNDELKKAVQSSEKAAHAAESANRAKSEFLSNMSHDIRTPMNAIVGISELMGNEHGLSDKMKNYIHKIRLTSNHLLSLINDVLDMSKIESGEVALNSEPVSLAEQVGQVDSIIRARTNERGQKFEVRVSEIAHEYLIGDNVRLRQVFLNLLSNASKYTPAGGSISFTLAEIPCEIPDHARFVITVSDNGCGMTQDFIKHIYEPFTRAENSTTNRVQGTGLGMAITKNIVDMMGGTIRIESEPGEGSTFEIELVLPIDREHVEKNIGTVLLITDDNVFIRNVTAAFSETESTLKVVSKAEEAMELMSNQSADVILISGHIHDEGFSDRVQLLHDSAKKALFFCSDYVQQENEEAVLRKSRIDGLITRPFFYSNLVHYIEQITYDGCHESDSKISVLTGLKFLCAEDNELNAEILSAILDIHGASCTIYPNGEEIVKAFEQVKPGDYDAILMDVQMPKMNGLEAARAIRSGTNPLGKTIPILAMTANAFSDDIQNSIDAGMNAHISKPIDISILESKLSKLLNIQ